MSPVLVYLVVGRKAPRRKRHSLIFGMRSLNTLRLRPRLRHLVIIQPVDCQIGGEIFRRFKVTVDLSRKRMILEPNKNFNDPFDVEEGGV